MKKLLLIRHAKSSWDDPSLKDFDRPLNDRGLKNAPMMAKRLKTKNIIADIIYASCANRTKTTALIIAQELNSLDKIKFIDSLYDTSYQNILNIIQKTPNEINTIFVVGHNPELGELAKYLVNFIENLPTAGTLHIQIDTKEWANLSPINSTLLEFDYPKKTN